MNLPVPDDHRVWAQALALREAGASVLVICPALRGHRPGTHQLAGIAIRYFRSFDGQTTLSALVEGLWTSACAGLLTLLSLRRCDKLQVCNPPDSMWPLLLIARLRGIPTFYDQHDVVPVLALERGALRHLSRLFLFFESLTVRFSSCVLTTSATQVRRLREVYGVDAQLVRTAAPTISRRSQAAKWPPVFGYLGVMGEQDGVLDLVAAVEIAASRSPFPFTFMLAGAGPSLGAVQSAIASRGLQDTITCLGWLAGAHLNEFLGGIDCMVVPDPPTPFNDLCAMNKVTHAMAVGIPIVMRPLTENQALVGRDAFIAEDASIESFADALCAALSAGPDEWSRLGTRLKETYSSALAWDANAPRYVAAILGDDAP